MYFDQAAVKTLCANTDKNAAKNIAAGKNFKWTELTETEMYQYIGITLYMGILKLPTEISGVLIPSFIRHILGGSCPETGSLPSHGTFI